MSEDLVVGPLPSKHTARFKNKPEGSHFLWRRFWCCEHGMLELVERLLQPGVPLGAMDFPMRVSPLADPRVVSFCNADPLISGRSIINLLIVDSTIFDHGFDQSVAQAGTIGSA